ncbi:MAG TPA: hypothetical protein VEK07_20290 [Polyangiaceae bacterium]|nr:hypothetical protein [Polyangiaceae bacterium]
MRIRRRAAWELPDPIPDNGSLRPHVLPSDWPPPAPRARGRSSASQFVAGMIVGIAASLLVTAWAVRSHRWPGTESFARATVAPPMQICPPPPPAAPMPAVVTAQAPAPNPVAAATNAPAITEKVHKKGKPRSKSAIARGGETTGATTDSAAAMERRAAQELGEAAPEVTGRPAAPAPTSTETTAHLADQAAAELSTSLK